jgi:hypothetical protein
VTTCALRRNRPVRTASVFWQKEARGSIVVHDSIVACLVSVQRLGACVEGEDAQPHRE